MLTITRFLKSRPDELNILATHPQYAEQLDQLRRRAEEYDVEMTPASDAYFPTHSHAVDVLNYIRVHQPELHQRMLNGEEIGYRKSNQLYKEYQKANEEE